MPNGLALSRALFDSVRPMLTEALPDIMSCSAAGLAGEGSDCLGLDDEISRDHDWGPAFCLWIPEPLFLQEQSRIECAFARIPSEFMGFPVRMRPEQRAGRCGPMAAEAFWRHFLRASSIPRTWREWRSIREYHLCSCTNGEVFMDASGAFSAMRAELLKGWPDDVRRKKIAARCMIMAQAGQYNLPRCLQRGDTCAAMLAAARFAEAALSMAFLLSRRYMPFYKWASKAAATLPVLGGDCAALIRRLSRTDWGNPESGIPAVEAIEAFCGRTADEIRAQGLAAAEGSWLWNLGPEVQMGIRDPELRRLNVMED